MRKGITNSDPLVSIVLISYNSATTILDTLNSIRSQTYRNLELIISDDHSRDNTVEVCRNWLAKNTDRFIRTEIIESDINTGIPANENRGSSRCQGEWIKTIAGDDLLVDTCVGDLVAYCKSQDGAHFVFCRVEPFDADAERINYYKRVFKYENLLLPRNELLKKLSYGNFLPAPGFFYNREAMMDINVKNDERIPMIEDWPKWINILKAGGNFHFFDKELVRYRVGGTGVASGGKASIAFTRSMALIYAYYQFPIRIKFEPSIELVKRMLYSKFIASPEKFWAFSRAMYEKLCKIRGVEPEYRYD